MAKRAPKPSNNLISKTQRKLERTDPLDKDGNPINKRRTNNKSFDPLMKIPQDQRDQKKIDYSCPSQDELKDKLQSSKQLNGKQSQIDFVIYGYQPHYDDKNRISYWDGHTPLKNYVEALFQIIEDFCPDIETVSGPFKDKVFLPAFLDEVIKFIIAGVKAKKIRTKSNGSDDKLKVSIEKSLRKHINDHPRLAKKKNPKIHRPGHNHPTLVALRKQEKAIRDENEKDNLAKIIKLFEQIMELTYSVDGDLLISKTFANTIARYYLEARNDPWTKASLFQRLKEFEDSFEKLDKTKEKLTHNNVFKLLGLKYNTEKETFDENGVGAIINLNTHAKKQTLIKKWNSIDSQGKAAIKSEVERVYKKIKKDLELLSSKEDHSYEKVKGKSHPLKNEDQLQEDLSKIKALYIDSYRSTGTKVGESLAKKIELHLKKRGH